MVIIFGGAGFIGRHLVNSIKDEKRIFDLDNSDDQVEFLDVREPIDLNINEISTIYNLAAIHKTPGHEYHEYFETNVLGAQNIVNFAIKQDVKTIVFTSSIAPYGSWEDTKFENSIPMPTSAYGISKLIAEEIFKQWQIESPDQRKLIILRPGVVYGKGENGNFTRLFRAIKKKRFFFPGRTDTKKAAVYVKDLIQLMIKMAELERTGIHLYNVSCPPTLTIKEIADAMAEVTKKKKSKIVIPSRLLLLLSHVINIFGKVFNITFDGIHPDRVKKLMISTDVNGEKVIRNGYKFEFTLKEAIVDWQRDCGDKDLF